MTEQKQGMSKGRIVLAWIFFICLGAVLVGSLALRILNTPLAPKLKVTESPIQSAPTEITPVVEAASEAQPTQTSGACGAEGSLTLLVLGESDPNNNYMRGADAIRLVNVNFDTNEIKVTAFPPVLWANTSQIPLLKSDGSTLTAAYYIAKQSLNGDERNKMAYASNVVAQTLANNFRISADNYITMKESTFTDIVNTLGGVTMNLPAGELTLNGQQALDYSRLLGSNPALISEWNRFDRQNQLLVGISHEISSFESVSSYPGLVNDYYKDVVTDLSIKQLADLTCVFQKSEGKFEYVEFKRTLLSGEQNDVLLPNTSEITQYYQTNFTP